MTIYDLAKMYSNGTVEEALAMMGAGWSAEDSVEDIVKAHDGVTEEEAAELLEVIKKVEEMLREE